MLVRSAYRSDRRIHLGFLAWLLVTLVTFVARGQASDGGSDASGSSDGDLTTTAPDDDDDDETAPDQPAVAVDAGSTATTRAQSADAGRSDTGESVDGAAVATPGTTPAVEPSAEAPAEPVAAPFPSGRVVDVVLEPALAG